MLHKIKNRKGFTLIELIIVVALMAVVTLPAAMAFRTGWEVYVSEQKIEEKISQGQRALNRINERCRIQGFDNVQLVSTVPGTTGTVDAVAIGDDTVVYYYAVNTIFYEQVGADARGRSELANGVIGFTLDRFPDSGDLQGFYIELTLDGGEREISVDTMINLRRR